ncbi:MAG TPA: threo-3-hydroxy-L-aspartate ammonia-lyase [Thermoanaerobaculia bacterium]|nr:threo-3-hydroxy-L-aspartate ammonia-lyase [Thermoanaerobaculia bacterium]
MTDLQLPVSPADVLAARERLRGIAHQTPVVTSRTLDERVGGQVFLKAESFQRVGAFKIRGAYNAISQLSAEEKARGVLAYSSGNHAQGVALASRLLGVPATIVMPLDAPAVKRAATEGYGARVLTYDPAREQREEVAAEVRERTGAVLIPPFDHPQVIAGQGTAALELFEQVGPLDALLVPCGGGGLLSGSALAAVTASPGCRVIGVEPELADDAARSFATGLLQRVENPRTIADGTRTASLGQLTFAIIRARVADFVTVSEAAIAGAVRFLFERTKLVVEPSGALGVAALLSGGLAPQGSRVGVILSGGNVDAETFSAILSGVYG